LLIYFKPFFSFLIIWYYQENVERTIYWLNIVCMPIYFLGEVVSGKV
jgi:hypothetical protein